LAAADEETAVAFVLTPGQQHDAPMLDDVLAEVPEACPVNAAVMDKAYDSDAIREKLASEGIKAVIPSKNNRVESIPHDKKLYRRRNCVERLVSKLKQFRAVATRYDKLGCTFMAFVHLVAAFVMAR
jgi:transposase